MTYASAEKIASIYAVAFEKDAANPFDPKKVPKSLRDLGHVARKKLKSGYKMRPPLRIG